MSTRPAAHHAIDTAAIATLVGLSLIAVAPAYAGLGFAVAGGLGVVIGVAAGTVAAWRRWHPLAAVGLALGGYFAAGGYAALRGTLIAGAVPALDTVRELAVGVVTAWKDALTVEAPISGPETTLLVPFITTLACATAAAFVAWQRRLAGWAMVPIVAAHVAMIAFGTYQAVAPVAQAVAATALAVAWLAWRRWHVRRADDVEMSGLADGATKRAIAMRRLGWGSATLTAALVGGGLLGAVAVPTGDREVLRDDVVPPFELEDYASPLQQFRAFVDDDADNVLVSVEGLPPGARVRLATLDAYDGVVYGVAADGSRASGAFTRFDSAIAADSVGTPATVRVTIGELTGVWLPGVGEVESVEFDGPRAAELRRSAFYNPGTDTAVVTAGVSSGDRYTLQVSVPPSPGEDGLANSDIARVALPDVDNVPETVASRAIDIVADSRGDFEQLVALRDFLSSSGYFSHGLDGQAPSLSGHGGARIADLLGGDEMVGDDEQYAVAYALMLYELGIPARVVLGAYPAPDAEGAIVDLTGDDVHVWVEVPFTGIGWVALDPAPAEDDTLVDDEQDSQREPKPVVLQPPPPPEEPAKLPPTVPADDPVIDQQLLDAGLVLAVLVAVAAAAGVLFLLVGPPLAVLLAKAQRRARRRRAARMVDRISGGWDEFVDGSRDRGATVVAGATRLETGRRISRRLAAADSDGLAAAADARVWSPEEVTSDDVANFWAEVDASLSAVIAGLPWWRRWGVRLSLRSLGGRRSARAIQAVDRMARRREADDVPAS